MGRPPDPAIFHGSNGGGAAPGRMDPAGTTTKTFAERKDDPGGSPSFDLQETKYFPTVDSTVQLMADSAQLASHSMSRGRFIYPLVGYGATFCARTPPTF